MSQRHAVQDATGVVATDDGGDILIVATGTSPGSSAGYQTGCLWIDTSGKKLYINTNTTSSATWTVVGSQS